MFKDAVKALTRQDDEPKPAPRRKSGETDKGFNMAGKAIMRRVVETPPQAYAAAGSYLFATLDWMNPFHNDASSVTELDNHFDNSSDTDFPNLHL